MSAMRMTDGEAVEREAKRILAEFQTTRGARLVATDELFAAAVIQRVREMARGAIYEPWDTPH